MPENDPYVNAPHLAPRMAVPAGAYGPQPGIPERTAAFRIGELLAAGDAGGVRHLFREAENGIRTVDVWRLLDHLLDLGMIRPRDPGASTTTAPGAGNASPQIPAADPGPPGEAA